MVYINVKKKITNDTTIGNYQFSDFLNLFLYDPKLRGFQFLLIPKKVLILRGPLGAVLILKRKSSVKQDIKIKRNF